MTLLQLTPLKEIVARWNKRYAIPLNIELIDHIIGGLLPCHLHVVRGEPGAGKTWFCIHTISCLFQKKPEAQILFSDFSGHFRITNLKKVLPSSRQLKQITILRPDNLIEQIVFFRKLLEDPTNPFDLIILDSLFGSPLDVIEYSYKGSRVWNKRIFSHLFDLKRLALEQIIPIVLTNHSRPIGEFSDNNFASNQCIGHIVEQFVPIDILIQKINRSHNIEVRIFRELIGCTDFEHPSNRITEM